MELPRTNLQQKYNKLSLVNQHVLHNIPKIRQKILSGAILNTFLNFDISYHS